LPSKVTNLAALRELAFRRIVLGLLTLSGVAMLVVAVPGLLSRG
jgi:hypothetical protein